jgi:hypothetical protein
MGGLFNASMASINYIFVKFAVIGNKEMDNNGKRYSTGYIIIDR